MQVINEQNIEAYLEENVKQSSRKVYRSYAKKFLNLQIENPSIERMNDLIQVGKTKFPDYKTWFQVEKTANSVMGYVQKNNLKAGIEKFSNSTQNIEGKTVSELEESLRQKQAEAQVANRELKEKQEAEKIEREALAKAKKEALILEAKKIAEEKAKREAGFYPIGRALEIIQKEADTTDKAMSTKIDPESLKVEPNIPQSGNYIWLENERAMISSLLSQNMNVFVHGSAGLGKSSMANQYGFEEGMAVIRVGGNSEAIPDDLLYEKSLNDSKITYFAQGFMQAIEIANRVGACILVLEELNLNPETVQTSMHSLMDDIKSQMTKIGKLELRKNCKLLIFATGNLGYAGVEELTPALESRMFFYQKKRPTKEFVFANIWTEKVSLDIKEKFWKVCTKINESTISKDHVFDIREPKRSMAIWDSMPRELILADISSRWADNIDDQQEVERIVKGVFA